MIRLEDVEAAIERLATGQNLRATIVRERPWIRPIVQALVDETNAELERLAGAILERVGARDLTPADVARIAGKPEPVDTSRELTGDFWCDEHGANCPDGHER